MKLMRMEMKQVHIFNMMLASVSCLLLALWFRPVVILLFFIHVVYLVRARNDNILGFLFFIMPFASIYKLAPGTMSLVTVLELFCLMLMLFRNPSINRKVLLGILLFVGFAIIVPSHDIVNTIKVLLTFLLLYYFSKDGNYDTKKCVLMFSYGLLISSFVSLLRDEFPLITEYISDATLYTNSGNVMRFAGLFSDPNYYAVNIMTCNFALLALFKQKLIGNSFWVYTSLLSAFGAMTYSKSLILMLLIYFSLLLFMMFNRKYAVWFGVLVVFGALLIWGVLYSEIDYFVHIRTRFVVNNMDDMTTGRSSLFKLYLNYISDNLRVFLLGEGLGAELLLLNGTGKRSHNTFIDMIYFLGVLNSIVYLYIIVYIAKIQKKYFRRQLYHYLPLACVVVMYNFLSALLTVELPFLLLLSYAIYNMNLQSDVSFLPYRSLKI